MLIHWFPTADHHLSGGMAEPSLVGGHWFSGFGNSFSCCWGETRYPDLPFLICKLQRVLWMHVLNPFGLLTGFSFKFVKYILLGTSCNNLDTKLKKLLERSVKFSSLLFCMIHTQKKLFGIFPKLLKCFLQYCLNFKPSQGLPNAVSYMAMENIFFWTNCTSEKLFLTFSSTKHARWHVTFE